MVDNRTSVNQCKQGSFWNINFGNVVAMIVPLVAIVYAYGGLVSKVSENSQALNRNSARIDFIDASGSALARTELRVIAAAQNAQAEQMRELKMKMDDIQRIIMSRYAQTPKPP